MQWNYTGKLVDEINEFNNHSTIKIKPVDLNWSTYIDFNKENLKEDLKFEVGDHVRILKYKRIFAKASKLVRIISCDYKIQKHCAVDIFRHTLKKLVECFTKKSCTKQTEKNLE